MYSISNSVYYQMNMLCFTPIEQLGDWGRYLYGLYFMSSLITTIAFGDIVGKNPYEGVNIVDIAGTCLHHPYRPM